MNDGAREQPLHNNADRIAAQHTGKRIEMIEGGGKSMGPKRDLLWQNEKRLVNPIFRFAHCVHCEPRDYF